MPADVSFMESDVTFTEAIPVRFSGPGAGCGPLTWGQQQVLIEMADSGQTLNMTDAQVLPHPAPVSEVAQQLAALMSRLPSLRTRIPAGPDGRPQQVAAESGEMFLHVADVADSAPEEEAITCANTIWRSQMLTPVDLARDWLMQMAVVRQRGLARYWVWTIHHLVGDGKTIPVLQGELGYGMLAGCPAATGTMSMLELAQLERTPRLQAVSKRAMRYWEAQLERLPPLTFGAARYPGRLGQRYWHGNFNSAAAYLGTLAIARQTGTDTSRVLLALLAIAIGRATGVSPLTTKYLVNNRYRPGYADIMAPLSMSVPLTVDVSGVSVAEAIARTRRAATAAAMFGYYDPEHVAELTGRLDARRGYPAQVAIHINDPRTHVRPAAEAAARTREITARDIQDALGETWFSWDGTVPGGYYTDQAFLTIREEPDTVLLQFVFDMACFTEAQAEGLAHEIERVAIDAAADPEIPTGVVPGQARY